MTKPGIILSSNRSAAASVAVAILCVLGLVQLVSLAHTGWQAWRGTRLIRSASAVEQETNTVLTPQAIALLAPQKTRSSFDAGSLPPLPAIPGAAKLMLSSKSPSAAPATDALPPLPKLPGELALRPQPALPPLRESRSTPPLPPTRVLTPDTAPLPQPVPRPAAQRPTTGNEEVDELLEAAQLSREANLNDDALKALERADLILPDHPLVLRQKALTFSKMGQVERANGLFDRAALMGPLTAAPGSPTKVTANAPGNLSNAFGAAAPTGPIALGQCTIARDPSDTTGEKVILKLPVRSAPGASISANDWNVDVFFFDKVDDVTIEPTKSDPPVYSFDLPVDFQSGEEVVTVVYHMPRLSEKELSEFGHRAFHGYVAKLYYQGRLMASAAAPRELMSRNDGGAAAPNPLLPAPTR